MEHDRSPRLSVLPLGSPLTPDPSPLRLAQGERGFSYSEILVSVGVVLCGALILAPATGIIGFSGGIDRPARHFQSLCREARTQALAQRAASEVQVVSAHCFRLGQGSEVDLSPGLSVFAVSGSDFKKLSYPFSVRFLPDGTYDGIRSDEHDGGGSKAGTEHGASLPAAGAVCPVIWFVDEPHRSFLGIRFSLSGQPEILRDQALVAFLADGGWRTAAVGVGAGKPFPYCTSQEIVDFAITPVP